MFKEYVAPQWLKRIGVRISKPLIVLCLLVHSIEALSSEWEHPPTIAIIIDDLGNHKEMGDRLIGIPAPLTLAFLPLRRFTEVQAKHAYFSGKEVMLHAPMENLRALPLGKGGVNQ